MSLQVQQQISFLVMLFVMCFKFYLYSLWAYAYFYLTAVAAHSKLL